MLVPITGCSINPARSVGPAIISVEIRDVEQSIVFDDLWVFIAGPMLGAIVAAFAEVAQRFFRDSEIEHEVTYFFSRLQ